jgi:hypothetical protein
MSRAAPVQSMPTTSALPVGVPGTSLTPKFQVFVRFRRRMRVQHVYSMIVELRPAEKGAPGVASGDSVIARPCIPGAHVQPVEQELGPKASNSTLTFSVTPLAAGRLKGSRLQIVHQGRILEEIRTPMRGIRPGRFILWGCLTFVALLFLLDVLWPLPNLHSNPDINPGGKTVIVTLGDRLPDYLTKENLPEGLSDYLTREAIGAAGQDAYNYLYAIPNLTAYITAGLLLLTLLSLFWNRPALWRSRRKGKPMMLPSLPTGSAHPLAFSSR